MNLPKWVKCELCDWNEPELNGMACGNCVIKNKDSYSYTFKNDKIQNGIHNIFKDYGLTEMDNDVIADELVKKGLL